jgi:hypothetical protein
VQHQLIRPDRTYTLATVDNFMFIPFFPTVAIKGQVKFLMPDFFTKYFWSLFTTTLSLVKGVLI